MKTPDASSEDSRRNRSRSGDIAGLIVMAIIVGAWAISTAPSTNGNRGGARHRTKCLNNIRNIAFAVLAYEREHGSLPPAYVADKDGRPLYSWRVLMLPYLDRPDLFREFHLDEPWDSPHNKPLSDKVIEVFRCPDGDDEPTCTNYFAVVGPNLAWKGSEATRLSEITDQPERTILLVEAADMGIHWAEPRDLHINQIPLELNPERGHGMSSHHRGGSVMVAFVGGSARVLAPDTPGETLRRLLEINDGQMVEEF